MKLEEVLLGKIAGCARTRADSLRDLKNLGFRLVAEDEEFLYEVEGWDEPEDPKRTDRAHLHAGR